MFPLLEIQITTSSSCTLPKSPCIASAACIKTAGVPVELKVATILVAILALFPIPVTITRPFELNIKLTASVNELFNKFAKLAIALLSKRIVSFAVERIAFASFKLKKF